MDKVIAVLERQIRLEEAAIFHNKIERDAAKTLPGYKGPALYTEHPEYIEELKKAVAILKSASPIKEPEDQKEQEELWHELREDMIVSPDLEKTLQYWKSKYIIKRRVE